MKRFDLLATALQSSLIRLLGQLIAFASGLTISATFGATSATDNYYTALILPAAIANLIMNVLTNLFAPIYLNYIHRDPTEQIPILSSLGSVTIAALAVGAGLSLVAVPISISLRDIQASFIVQALIFGVVLVSLTPIVGFTRLLSAVSEAHGHYRVPALAALFNPFIFLLTLLATAEKIGIYSLLCANLAGQATELIILTVYIQRNLHVPFRLQMRLHPAVHEMLSQSFAPALTYGALFFVPTFDRAAASMLNPGSLTIFHYGERLVAVLDLVITGSVISVISNSWAQRAAEHGVDAVASTFNLVVSTLLFALIPLSLGGFVLRYPIFSTLFHHGLFTSDGTSAQVFGILLLSAPLNYLIIVIVRLLLIVKDVRAQLILAVSISVLNTILNILLAPSLGIIGIALSTLLSRGIILVLSYFFLRNHFPQIRIKLALSNIALTFLCAVIMGAFLFLLQSLFSPTLSRDNGLLSQIIMLGAITVIGGSIYIFVAHLVHHPEWQFLRTIVTERLSAHLEPSQPST